MLTAAAAVQSGPGAGKGACCGPRGGGDADADVCGGGGGGGYYGGGGGEAYETSLVAYSGGGGGGSGYIGSGVSNASITGSCRPATGNPLGRQRWFGRGGNAGGRVVIVHKDDHPSTLVNVHALAHRSHPWTSKTASPPSRNKEIRRELQELKADHDDLRKMAVEIATIKKDIEFIRDGQSRMNNNINRVVGAVGFAIIAQISGFLLNGAANFMQ